MILRFFDHNFDNGQRGYIGNALELETKAVDHDKRQARWTLSQEVPDRARLDKRGREAGDIVRVDGIQYKHFRSGKMPLLQFHDHERHSVGVVHSMGVEGNKFKGTVELNPEGINPDADILWGQIAAGHHETCSIGFIAVKALELKSDDDEDEDRYGYRPRDFQKIYLLETSLVPIPMLQTALMDKSGEDADDYALQQIAADIVGHNPRARTEEDVAALIQRFGVLLRDQWAQVHGYETTVPEDESKDEPVEPPAIVAARDTVDDIVAKAIDAARRKYAAA